VTNGERRGSWSVALLTASEPGRRNRRTVDAIFLAWGAIVIALSAAIASSAPDHDRRRTGADHCAGVGRSALACRFLRSPGPRSSSSWTCSCDGGRTFSAIFSWAASVLGAASLLGWSVQSDWFPVEAHALSRWGYPELRLASATMVLVVVGPELVRPVRLLAIWLVPSAALGAVVLGAALPSEASAHSLRIGVGALVHSCLAPPPESKRERPAHVDHARSRGR
jgi:hypothetical protein